MDIWESKQILDAELGQRLGAQAIAQHWLKNVTSEHDEQMCPGSAQVDAAFTIMKRFFATDGPAGICAIKSDSIYKWDALIKKARSEDYLAWCVTGIIDAARDGLIVPEELSLRQLTGRGPGAPAPPALRCFHL